MEFFNSYEDETRAEAYSKLEFTGTYYVAFRDLPRIIKRYVNGKNALDFGCGTGRSTRFLNNLGFNTTGIDISIEMIRIAKKIDTKGEYRLINKGDYKDFNENSFNLILSCFTFDNIPMEKKVELFSKLKILLHKNGMMINLVSSPEMYTHEWTSFSTKDFPENKNAKTGDMIPIITTDINDKRPCYDIFCTNKDYKKIYENSGLQLIDVKKPLATGYETYSWVNETKIAPWVIYVLNKK